MAQYTQVGLSMACLAAIKLLDLEDPSTIFFVRCAFACGAILTFITLGLLYLRIQSANDNQELVVTGADLNPPQPLASMMGAPADPEANKPQTITVKAYDMLKWNALLKAAMTTIAITTALHLWKGFMPPLILQSVLAVANVLTSEIAGIHFLGQTQKNDPALKRPFKPKSMWSGFADLKKEMKDLTAQGEKSTRKNKKQENLLARKQK
jgi:hypothetical protein